ncbi:DUF1405 domain-containing protein [Halolamina sp.]|jgi:uncharacterized membrane protein YpjA|uniref:DUF1405 domain-containing protein n=1 Tax=Halolamina sp. TaxID=1940283 RepID=UPI000223B83F|nr:protein of unknown function DUF1405 [halophilic archaeon DL31]
MLPGFLDRSRLPDRASLPRWLAPLPRAVEDLGLRAVWLVVLINAVGTAFGFWYYGFHPIPLSDPLITGQLAREPALFWLFVPDSPGGTLFVGLAFGMWGLGRRNEYLNALAFFGCLKLGFWTPFVLTVFAEGFLATTAIPMYLFLFFSHLAMVVEAFVLHRISDFPVKAVAVALFWYGLNDVVDYFVPVLGSAHHTYIPGQLVSEAGFYTHPPEIHTLAAAGAVVLTLAATFLALATRVRKLELNELGF